VTIRRSRPLALGWVFAAAVATACPQEKKDPPPEPASVELSLERLGAEVTIAATFPVRVHVSVDVPVALVLDGVAVVTARRDGEAVDVPIAGLTNGAHALVASAEVSGARFESAPLAFTVERTPPVLVSWAPMAGPTLPPLVVTATFDEPVFVVKAELLYDLGPVYAVATSTSGDGRTVYVPLGSVWDTARVRLTVKDALGNTAAPVLGGWSPGPFEASLSGPAPGTRLRGEVDLLARWRGPESILLDVDRLNVTTLTAPPGPDGWREAAARLDTRAFADGAHAVRLWTYGLLPLSEAWTFDNSAPVRKTCGPRHGAAADAPAGEPVVATFDEPVTPVASPGVFSEELVLLATVPGPLPHTWSGGSPDVRDEAGNIAAGEPCAEVVYPVWRAPVGPGPIPAYMTEGASAARLVGLASGWAGPYVVLVAFWSDQVEFLGGLDIAYRDPHVYDWSLSGIVRSPSFVAGAGGSTWVVEESFASSLTFRSVTYSTQDELYVGVVPAARFPQRAIAVAADGGVAWTDGAAGARALRVSWRQRIGRATLDAGMNPAAEVEGAALAVGAPRLAWLERAPGGPALLHLREASGSPLAFGPDLGPLNADPAASASEPALLASAQVDAVAWVEGGKVLVRSRAPGEVGFGPAVVANADPARSARTPVFAVGPDGPMLAFVEEGAAAGRIEIRRFGAGAWTAEPSLALELGVVGAEVSFAWPGVLWRAGGETRVRVFNR